VAARALMFQGTGSDVGKSLIVAGLCRAFTNRGLRVRPFKPQNMSNNAAVTRENGEIGRAQALQARAARAEPSVHMNPVLLKPQGGSAQIVVQGRVVATASARDYQPMKSKLMPAVLESFGVLRGEADLVLVEGAGSASETNLRASDIANMGFSRAADVPVVLIGDIDRGGVIASLVGTRHVVDEDDAAMIRGFIVNRFRGDPSLFADGMTEIARLTGWDALGLVPHFDHANRLPAEDSLALTAKDRRPSTGGRVRIAVPILPHISNFDDLDPLEAEPDVEIVRVRPGRPLPGDADLVLLPGSKATIADLAAFRHAGFDIDLAAHLRRGGHVLGLCGGYQMLGRSIADPDGIEGSAGTVDGLGLLDVATVLTARKSLRSVGGSTADGLPFRGYEMHVGETTGPDAARPFAILEGGRPDGASSPSGLVHGTYVHGFFSDDRQRAAWVTRLGGGASDLDYERRVEETLDELAMHLATHVDLDRLLSHAR
jgi:adenosylcobyric acid synthase